MGYGPAHFVRADSLLPYTIHFENETNATAPAQQVVVSDRLTNRLDWTTFELTEIAFGDQFIAVPPHTQHFEQTAKLRQNGFDFEVQIEAGIHLDTGEVYARFQSLNPTNGLPPPVDIGLLPPENGTGRGQGHVSYVIRATNGLATGTEIRNVAWITFDQQPAIATDLIDPHDVNSGHDTNKQALVTIDADLPTGTVQPLAGTATNATFTVSWTGSDVGAGVAGYDVYVQSNGGPWAVWLANYPLTSEVFYGQNGRLYCFYSLARDGVGNVQTNYTVACTQTLSNYPPTMSGVSNQLAVVGGLLMVTNWAYDPDGVTFSLGPGAPAGASITTNGIFTWTPACAQGSSNYMVQVWATDGGTPRMSNSITFTVLVPECIEASVGNTVMLVGSTSSVPVRLLSTTALTNMAFTVAYPLERFTNFTLTVNSPQVITQGLNFPQPGQVQASFTLPAASVLHGPTNVGQLGFTALSNQSSAFVPLPITGVHGLKPDGSIVGNAYGLSGRVVVVGPEPLLEAWLATNGSPMLTLYGKPGSSYALDWRTNLMTGAWQFNRRVPMTNLSQDFGIEATKPSQFFRAYEFFADPPVLELGGRSRTNLTLLIYGTPGTNYMLQATTNVSVGSAWLPLESFTLTNSFRFHGVTNSSEPARFFRALRE